MKTHPDYNPTPPREKIVPVEQDPALAPHQCEVCGQPIAGETPYKAEATDYVKYFCSPACRERADDAAR